MSNRSLAFTAERLLQVLDTFPEVNTYLVGFSGGADSTALLHALGKIRGQLHAPVSAVHVNHGIHPDADLWQRQCEQFCRRLGIELTCLKIELENNSGKGMEAEARHLRYEAITSLLRPSDCLLTAHHADDQAETLLLNLMRGSGVEGLTAMPENRPLGNGFLQRPLLQFKNSALKHYLSENNIEWIEDPSNQYLNHDRNFVRHGLIPLMQTRWPDVSQRLMLTQEAMTDARHLLEKIADEYLAPNLLHPHVLQITPECGAEAALFRLVIRRWLRQTGAPVVPAYKLGSFCEQVKSVESDHKVSVSWDGWLLRFYKNCLWLQTDLQILPCPTLDWPDWQIKLALGEHVGDVSLKAQEAAPGQPRRENGVFPEGKLRIANRGNMKEAVINHGGHHKRLKKLFQAGDIPPWLRDSIPLCALDGEIVAIGDWCFSERFTSWLSEYGVSLEWRPGHPLLKFVHEQQHKVNH